MSQKKHHPPRLANWLLKRLVQSRDYDFASGDLSESYSSFLNEKGRFRANLWFWGEVLRSIPVGLTSRVYWGVSMFKSYFKVAIRNMNRHKGYSFINIFGLALGIACCMILLMWVYSEWCYDRFHENKNDIYRVYDEQIFTNGQKQVNTTSYYPLAKFIREQCPEVKRSVRFADESRSLRIGEQVYQETAGFADDGFLQMFSFPLQNGDVTTALSNPLSIILSQEVSSKLFGNRNPVGEIIRIDDAYDVTVTGVFKTLSESTVLKFDVLLPFRVFAWPEDVDAYGWGGNPLHTFLQLYPGHDFKETGENITAALKTHLPVPETFDFKFYLQPLTRMHLEKAGGKGGLAIYLLLVTIAAFLILVIAIMNFVNLSTARSMQRAREVGLRKVVGATRVELLQQFFAESFSVILISIMIAFCMMVFLILVFNKITDKHLTFQLIGQLPVLTGFFILFLFTTVLSAAYPSFLMSAYQPDTILRDSDNLTSGRSLLRKSLVICQFAIAVFLCIGTLFIYRQVQYIQKKDLGYTRENVLIGYIGGKLGDKFNAFKNELLKNTNILHVSAASESPSYVGSTVSTVNWKGKDPAQTVSFNWQIVDVDYLETLNLELTDGRFFSKEYTSDALNGFVINKEAMRLMSVQSPVGKPFSVFGEEGTVLGVVRNFHFQPLHHEIKPYVMMLGDRFWNQFLFVKIAPGSFSECEERIRTVYGEFVADGVLQLHFLDDVIRNNYKTEEKAIEIIGAFSMIAIFISVLGLVGLAAFLTLRRTKEIGIRKVLGCSTGGVSILLISKFMQWIVVANLIAWPIAYIFIQKWLENFAYRTNISVWIFLSTGFTTMVIALLTVGYQAIKAARSNPVDALKYE